MTHLHLVKVSHTLFFCTFWKSSLTQMTKSYVFAKWVQPSIQTQPLSLQTGWHCVHQVMLWLNKGSCRRLPTGYPTQWNPELQVSLWRASWRQRSFCDAFPSKLTGIEVDGAQCNRSEAQTPMFIETSVCVFACVCVFTHLLSGQSHCRTGSWWHPGHQTSQWQNLTLCINVRWWTFFPKNEKNATILITCSFMHKHDCSHPRNEVISASISVPPNAIIRVLIYDCNKTCAMLSPKVKSPLWLTVKFA